MITGMDHLYWREAGFYPCKICETSSSDISRLSFRDLRGGLSCMFLLNFNGNKSSIFCRVYRIRGSYWSHVYVIHFSRECSKIISQTNSKLLILCIQTHFWDFHLYPPPPPREEKKHPNLWMLLRIRATVSQVLPADI